VDIWWRGKITQWSFWYSPFFTNYPKGLLNDLWKFENGMWTFVSGSVNADSPSNFGEPRIPDPNAFPGARFSPKCWNDNNGHLWLYGGWGSGFLGDTWRFDGSNWAFWGGSTQPNPGPVYGDPKTFSFDHHPGGRDYTSVTASGSAAYLVGGWVTGFGRSGDIWKFESDKGWAFWSGNLGAVGPNPGTIKIPSETNRISSIESTMSVVDEFDNLWIFGGDGYSTSGDIGM
jgi:hypothetical protein